MDHLSLASVCSDAKTGMRLQVQSKELPLMLARV